MPPSTIKTMAEGNDKANEGMRPVISLAALEAFIAAITGAITSAVTSAILNMSPAHVNANAKKISSEINPYETNSMDLTLKDGKISENRPRRRRKGGNQPPSPRPMRTSSLISSRTA